MHPAPFRILTVAAVAIAGLALGCGGAASPSFFAQPADDAGTDDSGLLPDGAVDPDAGVADSGAPWSPVCPNALPATGTACQGENLQCEYGSASWNVSCDTVVQCQNGQWWSYQPSFSPCSPKPGANPSSCPANYASVPKGAACTTHGLSCEYAQGLCQCEVALGGPVPIDGGAGYWGCFPEQGCPFPRPRVGSECPSEGTYCTYEACNYAQSCHGGVWQAQQEACAAPAGGAKQ